MATHITPRTITKKKKYAKKKDKIQKYWENKINQAEETKDYWKKQFQVEALEAAYNGKQRPKWWPEEFDWYSINLLFSSTRVLIRNIVPNNLDVSVELQKSYIKDPQAVEQFNAQVKLRKAVMQYYFNTLNLTEEAEQAYLNSLWGFGCFKIGYSALMEANPHAGQPMVDKETGELILDENNQPIIQAENKTIKEEFFVDSIDPECFLVNTTCGVSLDKTGRWCAHKIFKTIKEIKEDSLYTNTKDLQGSHLSSEEQKYLKNGQEYRVPREVVKANEGEEDNEENRYVVLYEIYDLETKKTLTIARNHDKPLRMPTDVDKGIAPHPFVIFRLHTLRNSFYPIPGLFNLMGPQGEYNIRRNIMAVHLKQQGEKVAIDPEVPQEEVDKYANGNLGCIIRVDGTQITPIDKSSMGGDFAYDTSMLKQEFDEISQVGKLQRGQIGARSATEAEISEKRGREGEVDYHEIMMGALAQVANKLHKAIEAYLTQEGAVSILGPAGEEWFYFSPANFKPIEGEYLFKVRPDESVRETQMVERAQLLQFMDIIGKNPLIALSRVLMRELLNSFTSLENSEELIIELERLAMVSMGMQAQDQREGTGASQGRVEKTSGQVAGKAKKVNAR